MSVKIRHFVSPVALAWFWLYFLRLRKASGYKE